MIRRISPAEAFERMTHERYAYIDVRTVPEYESGHPAGAFNVPWASSGPSGLVPNPRFVAVLEERFGRTGKLILGCRIGHRSLHAAEALVAAGFTEVLEQRAGWEGSRDAFGRTVEPGWKRAGLPSALSAEPGRSWKELDG